MKALQITKSEADDRLKSKKTTWIGLFLLGVGIAMLLCRVSFFLHGVAELKFDWTNVWLCMGWGYTIFAAKDTLLKGMIGLMLPTQEITELSCLVQIKYLPLHRTSTNN